MLSLSIEIFYREAFNYLKMLYIYMTHVIYLAYVLYRICKIICEKYSVTNSFISECKKLFKKAPNCTEIFCNLHRGLA